MNNIEIALEVMEDFHKTMKKIHKKKEDRLFSKIEIKALFLIEDFEVITMKELASSLDITKPRVTVIVNKLLERNFVEYSLDNVDKRKKYLSITKLGKEYLDKEKEKYRKFFEMIWSNFTEEEQKQWIAITTKTIDILEKNCFPKEKKNANI